MEKKKIYQKAFLKWRRRMISASICLAVFTLLFLSIFFDSSEVMGRALWIRIVISGFGLPISFVRTLYSLGEISNYEYKMRYYYLC